MPVQDFYTFPTEQRDPFVAPPQTGRIVGGYLAAKEALYQSPLGEFPQFLAAEAVKHFVPGVHFTQQEWKNGPYFRPGLKVGAGGIDAISAIINAARIDSQIKVQNKLDLMAPGFLSSLSRGIGTTLGFALGNAPALAFWPEITAATQAYLGVDAAANAGTLAQLGIRAAGGVAAGAVTTIPDAMTRFGANQFFGRQTSILNPLMEVGAGAALGGALEGAFGRRFIISPESNAMAKQTAVSQSLMGKSVDVMPIVKNGYRDARAQDEAQKAELPLEQQAAIPPAQQNAIDDLQRQQNEIEKQLPTAQNKLTTEEGKPLVKRASPRGATLIDSINEALDAGIGKRTAKQTSLLTNESHLEEVHQAARIQKVSERTRSPQQQDFLNRVKDKEGEKALVKERLSLHQSRQQTLSETLPNETEANRDHRLGQLDRANFQTTMAQNRLNELNNRPSFSNSLKNAHVKLNQLTTQRNILRDKINDHRLQQKIDQVPPDAVGTEELKNSVSQIESAKGDAAFSQELEDALTQQLKDLTGTDNEIFDKEIENELNLLKVLDQQGELDPELQDWFKVAQSAIKDSDTFNAGFRKMADCLMGQSSDE